MEPIKNRTRKGLLAIIADPDTAVQVVSFTHGDGTEEPTFGAMRPGVDYWPNAVQRTSNTITFVNTSATIGLMWPSSWTYRTEGDGTAILATRQNREGGDRLVIRLHQPEVLAANWSASITPDRIEND